MIEAHYNWVDIEGLEGLYQISHTGAVKSLGRVVATGRRFPERLLRAHPDKDGYLRVVLIDADGRRLTRRVHRLVARAFCGPQPRGMQVCHNDGQRGNNNAWNLRWGTASENILDRVRHGRDRNARKTHCIRGHEFSAENTRHYLNPGTSRWQRKCETCIRMHYDARSAARRRSLGKVADA